MGAGVDGQFGAGADGADLGGDQDLGGRAAPRGGSPPRAPPARPPPHPPPAPPPAPPPEGGRRGGPPRPPPPPAPPTARDTPPQAAVLLPARRGRLDRHLRRLQVALL